MSEIVGVNQVNEIFNFGDHSVRTLKVGDNIYFNGKDVALALGIRNTDQTIRNNVDEEDMFRVAPPSGEGGAHRVYISEGAMYIFVIRSNKPASRPFVKWVKDVLVTIRKTGRYQLEDFKTLAEGVDKNTPNFEEIKQICIDTNERLKDPKKVERGRRGGLACQRKNRKREKENKQMKLELTMFRVKEKLVEKCKDEIEKQEAPR